MKSVIIGSFAGALLLAPAAASASVRVMVVGPSRVLSGPHTVSTRAARVRASGKSCLAPAGTALAALAGLRRAGGPAFSVRDYGGGACDPLFVFRIGPFANAGVTGWTYKVGRRAGTTAANDTSGPFGTGRRIPAGARVLWFFCRIEGSGCQRTLAVAPARRTIAPGGSLRVRVRGYDDRGQGVVVRGATVALGSATARTSAAGVAVLHAPARRGAYVLRAAKAGLSRGFPERVEVR
jgi:hypothetical protein